MRNIIMTDVMGTSGFMTTFTGRHPDPAQLRAEDVCDSDIAHALSLLCRGGGHLQHFYTVGQHSLNCAREAAARGASDRKVLACLLHDAAEAYISDMIRPLKIHFPGFRAIEDHDLSVIFSCFGIGDITPEETAYWKQIDDEMLGNELQEMMAGTPDRPVVSLASVPDFSERRPQDVEAEFLQYLQGMTEKIKS